MNSDLKDVENFLKNYDMKLGYNKTTSQKLMKQLNRQTLVSKSMRYVYKIDNFIIKTSSDATSLRLPIGADQCINEFNIYNSSDERLDQFKEILCPVYAIYESKFLYFTIHKLLTPLATNNNSNETLYTCIEKGKKFSNESKFLHILEKFKNHWITNTPQLQNEYSKISTFGHDNDNNLYILDYGVL